MKQTALGQTIVDFSKIESELRRVCRHGLRVGESMSKHTTIAAGGPARFFAVPRSATEVITLVRTAIKHSLPYMAMGRGSNLLVRDGGFDGLVIQVASHLAEIQVRARTAFADAGASFTRLGRVLTRNQRPGFEFAIGIPGSVGGAVRMNAGAFGSDVSRVLKSVRIIDTEGRLAVLRRQDLVFRYRWSSLPRGAIVLSAIFNCPPGEMDERRLKETLSRKETQPLSDRTFGSTFKNPPGGFAAQMIEACGLKGETRGGVMISKKHANFVVNFGENTRANDVEDLIRYVAETVENQFGVRLKPEVIIIGNR